MDAFQRKQQKEQLNIRIHEYVLLYAVFVIQKYKRKAAILNLKK